jgi:hypothetical protein
MLSRRGDLARGLAALAWGLPLCALLNACGPKKQTVNVTTGVGAPAPTQTTVVVNDPAVAAGGAGTEVEAAKETFRKVSAVKDMSEMASYLTNRSAAVFGVILMIPISLMTSMEEMGSSFENMGKDPNAPAAPAAPKKASPFKAEFETITQKYGIKDMQSGPDPAAMKNLEARGRELMRDLALLMEKIEKSGKSTGEKSKPDVLQKGPDDFEYTVVSPTRVRIVPKEKPKPGQPSEAFLVVEDGRWRLDFGGMEDMQKAMNAGAPSSSPPPSSGVGGGMAPPGPQ